MSPSRLLKLFYHIIFYEVPANVSLSPFYLVKLHATFSFSETGLFSLEFHKIVWLGKISGRNLAQSCFPILHQCVSGKHWSVYNSSMLLRNKNTIDQESGTISWKINRKKSRKHPLHLPSCFMSIPLIGTPFLSQPAKFYWTNTLVFDRVHAIYLT